MSGSSRGIASLVVTFTLAFASTGDGRGLIGPEQNGAFAAGAPANLSFTWDPPDEGDPTSYVLEAGSGPGLSDIAVLDTAAGDTTVFVGGIPSGTYYVRIKARNGFGFSEPSNEIVLSIGGGGTRVVADACANPQPPSGLTSTVSGSLVTIQWKPSADAASYQIEAGFMPGASDVFNGDVGPGSAIQTVAPPGSYFVRVRAKNGCGMSAPSKEIVINIRVPRRPQ